MLGFGVQGRLERERGATVTLVEFLRENMDSSDRVVRRKSLSERLGLKGFGCCGTTWGLRPNNISVRDDEDEEGGPQEPGIEVIGVSQTSPGNGSTPECSDQIPASSGMNLAAALAAERHFRAAQELDGNVGLSPSPLRPNSEGAVSDQTAGTTAEPGTPLRVSLMRLLEETDGCDHGEMEMEEKGGVGCESMCCVCMGRKKGAAFIPCGHTFCRVCSREVWLNRGFCPLCNRSILEILDIF